MQFTIYIILAKYYVHAVQILQLKSHVHYRIKPPSHLSVISLLALGRFQEETPFYRSQCHLTSKPPRQHLRTTAPIAFQSLSVIRRVSSESFRLTFQNWKVLPSTNQMQPHMQCKDFSLLLIQALPIA